MDQTQVINLRGLLRVYPC